VNTGPSRVPDFTAIRDRLSRNTSVRGRDVGREILVEFTGQEPDGYADGNPPHEASGLPAPMIHSLIGQLMDAEALSSAQTSIVANILAWYGAFWKQYSLLCSRPAWRESIVGMVRDYADGRRQGVFRPYYETLGVDPRQFAQWAAYLSTDELPSYLRESRSWRGPLSLMKTLADTMYFGSGTGFDPSSRDLDLHTCGSPSFLLLGDTGHQEFEASICWICPGTEDTVCGELCVDVWD
jgi:hypothetical protein